MSITDRNLVWFLSGYLVGGLVFGELPKAFLRGLLQ